MSLPKEPRQKMINLMYLVLTALLALNVSSEILNAFKTIDTSLNTAGTITDTKNKQMLASLQTLQEDPKSRDRALVWNPIAIKAQTISLSLINEIEQLKKELKDEAGGKVVDGVYNFKEDDLDAATRLFTLPAPAGKNKGEDLKNKLEGLRNQLLALHPDINAELSKSLPIDVSIPANAVQKDFKNFYFHMTPTVAGITVLSKFQNDIKNSVAQVIELCHKKVGEVKIVFDAYVPLVGTNATYFMPNEEIKINAGIGAFSTASNNTSVTIDGVPATRLPDGTYEYKGNVGGTGSGTKMVRISYFNQSKNIQETKEYPVKYTVGSPTGITVSAEKVKVFYVGLDNEISVSGGQGGAEGKKVSISGGGGSLQDLGNGRYNVRVTQTGEANVNVTTVADNKTSSFKFRVKKVPNPIAMVGASEGGPMSANAFKAQQGVRAELRDFIFEGVEFNVVSFTLVANGGSMQNMQFNVNQGALFTRDSRNLIEKCGPGTTVIIDEIIAVGPGGDRRKLPGISFQLQ